MAPARFRAAAPPLVTLALAAALLAGAPAAQAHDTWFEAVRGGAGTPRAEAPAPVVLALGTGTRFPAYEFPVGMEQIVRSGCRAGGGAADTPLRLVLDRPTSVLLRSAAPLPSERAVSCWAQLAPAAVDLDPGIVAEYMDEIQAPPAVREAWAAMQQRGVRWRETYTKHARIELGATTAAAAARVPMAMDVLMDAPQRPVRAGDTVAFQVLRDGAPLAGLAVELHPEDGRPGRWVQTDGDGRVRLAVDRPGRWLLRGTELRVVPGADRWVSGFVTLAFDVVAAPVSAPAR